MKRLTCALAAMVLAALPAAAADIKLGDITISEPFARASAGRARNGAAFLTITNTGDADRLLAASADVSAKTELHTHTMDAEGVARMRQVEHIDLPAGETVTLQPGGLHVMMMGLKAPLRQGDSFPLILRFENAGDVSFDVPIMGPGAKGHGGGMQHGHGMKKTN